jgi:hypothetical protein
MNWFGLFFVAGMLIACPVMGLICYIMEKRDENRDIMDLLKHQRCVARRKKKVS